MKDDPFGKMKVTELKSAKPNPIGGQGCPATPFLPLNLFSGKLELVLVRDPIWLPPSQAVELFLPFMFPNNR